ncbi:MAG: hypothetical protein JEZ09_20625 [Salinivirgaceae bacterium]|nr:hypothetical protein [Salinivirgaceae bacterium]
MKHFITILIICMFFSLSTNNAQAQKKPRIIEESSKKKPEWVNGLVKDFVIVVASSPTLDDAQQKALAKVKEQIISSVAENIQSTSEYLRSETVKNDDSDFAESFKTATKTRAADIPFVKGIALSKVDEFYWEKESYQDNIKYYYHVKYPFSRIQLEKLIKEYEKADQALTDQLEGILGKIDALDNLEEMSQTEKELEALAQGFIDVDPRLDQANVGIAKLKDMMKNFSIETVNNTLGEIRMILKIGEKTLTTSRKPSVSSNCAKIIDVKSKTPEWIITYSYEECYEDPDNVIKVTFKSSFGKASNEYAFNINAEKIDIFVNNDINLNGGTDNGTEIENAKGIMSITSKYDSPFIVEKIILKFGDEAPIIIDGINQNFTGSGKHDLEFTINQAISKENYSAKKYDMIKGTIHYKSVKTGEKSIYKMFNQTITTAW